MTMTCRILVAAAVLALNGPLLCAQEAPGGAAAADGPERGARVEIADFTYRRSLAPGMAGLVTLQLDAAVLAHSRGPDETFADVRVLDDSGAQIPYLLERGEEPLSSDLEIRPTTSGIRSLDEPSIGSRSLYAIDLPYSNLPNPRVVFETSDRVFRRTLRLAVERPPDRRHRGAWLEVLARSEWQHADQATPAPPIEMAIRPRDGTRLLLVVEEGDNRPLSIAAVRLLLPSWRLRFFRPPDRLHLVYGSAAAAAPQYDLRLLTRSLMKTRAGEVVAGPEEARGAASPAARLSPWMFWAGLTLAVVVLLGLIVRLISAGAPTPPSPSGP
jgi:hypothetical protein